MRKLVDATNINAPDVDYPKGRPRDENGGAGTVFEEVLVGDLIQFFQKLVIDSGITENDLPDNVSNGYQLLEALNISRYLNGSLGKEVSIAQSGTPYNIPDDVGLIEITYSGLGQQIINTPAPKAGRRIAIKTDGDQRVDKSFKFNTAAGWYLDQENFDPESATGFHQLFMESDGRAWMIVNWSAVLLACPFVYVNGKYIDEILKNHIGEKNNKIGIVNITNNLNIGSNIIKVTEEKDEITYFEYLKIIVDGQELINIGSFEMNKGEFREWTIDINKEVKNAYVEAKGYYINV